MKILMMCAGLYSVGGVESFFVNLANELSKNVEDEIHVVVFNGQKGVADKFKPFLKNEAIKFYFLDKKVGFDLKLPRKLRKLINDIGPDVINTHSSHTFRYYLMLNSMRRRPLVHTVTNNPYIHNKYAYHLYKLRLHQKKWNIKLVGISDVVSDRLAEVYAIDRKRISTIFNGTVPCERRNPKAKREGRFLICASLTDIKNHEFLLKSFAEYSKLNSQSTLGIVGNGPLKETLLDLTNKLGIEDKVCFKGVINNITTVYKDYDYFTLVSKSEGNPMVIVEAMSAGLPIVSSNVGGIPDLVEEGKNGYLFDLNEGNQALINCFEKIEKISDVDYEIISNNNVERASAWDIKNIASQYRQLFAERCGKK